MLEIFTRVFLLKIIIRTGIVYSSSFKCYKVFSLKTKNNPQKDASHLKHDKNSLHNKRYKKDIEKNGKWKTKSLR